MGPTAGKDPSNQKKSVKIGAFVQELRAGTHKKGKETNIQMNCI